MRWFSLAVLVIIVGCSGASNTVSNAVPNAPAGAIGPKLHLRIAHLGKPHYFFSRDHFRAQTQYRAHSGYYYGAGNLKYGGGPVDVTPKAYLIFWGITGPTDTTHDPDGVAPYLVNFFAALPNSSWLNTVTQYYGTSAGPTQFITNPTAAFTGAYYDPAPPSSTTYTDSDAAGEALKIANMFGYDANTNYIVVTPHGYGISGFGSSFCAYHSATTTTGSQLLSYTVFPYQPEAPSGRYPAGSNCGVGSVTTPGTLDGVSIVGGHEEAETITDANATSGWLDQSSPPMEIGDKCAWIHLQDTSFPNGRSYPTQPLWNNASSSCVQSYGGSTPTPTPAPPQLTNVIVNPGFETSHLKPWRTCSSRNAPLAFTTTHRPHSGTYDAYAGTVANQREPDGITSVCQLVTVPPNALLTVWMRGISNDKRRGVFQFARLYTTSGTLAKTFFQFNVDDKKWVRETASLAAYANGRYYLAFGIQGKKDAHGRVIGLYLDDVSLAP